VPASSAPIFVVGCFPNGPGWWSPTGQCGPVEDELERTARHRAARLLQCAPEQVAFVANTSTGISAVASAIPWRPGDNVVVAAGDFPAVTNAWTRLARYGSPTVRVVDAWDDPQALLAQVDERTRAVALATVNFATGQPLPRLPELAGQLRHRGVLVVVDAIQTLGTRPFAAAPYDVVVADGHKWLLAPKGCALMYVSPQACQVLEPLTVGWRNIVGPERYQPGTSLCEGARRFEAGSPNIVGLSGLAAALELLDRVGLDAVATRLTALRRLVARALDIAEPAHPDGAAPMVCLPVPGSDALRLHERLEHRVSTSVRRDHRGRTYLRIAPHFYNTEDDIARLGAIYGKWRDG
jgi:selenocysteine lyase/cysteine desulfurase